VFLCLSLLNFVGWWFQTWRRNSTRTVSCHNHCIFKQLYTCKLFYTLAVFVLSEWKILHRCWMHHLCMRSKTRVLPINVSLPSLMVTWLCAVVTVAAQFMMIGSVFNCWLAYVPGGAAVMPKVKKVCGVAITKPCSRENFALTVWQMTPCVALSYITNGHKQNAVVISNTYYTVCLFTSALKCAWSLHKLCLKCLDFACAGVAPQT